LIYTLLVTLALPFALLRLYLRGNKAPAYRLRWRERFGTPPFTMHGCIWLHVVSLGESIAATPLIHQLIAEYGTENILLTSITPTGSQYVTDKFPKVHHCYLPYDHPVILGRFFKKITPRVLLLMETELWPALLQQCEKRNIPSLLLNARMSERSKSRYKYFARTSQKMMSQLTHVAAQTQKDADRLLEMGLSPTQYSVTGNIKYDLHIAESVYQQGQLLKEGFTGRPVWIAASTHEGEETQILKAHQKIVQTLPDALLIIVPRHPERFNTVYQLTQDMHFSCVRRSDEARCTPKTQVYLGDTMGELMLMFYAADIAFIGGSLIARGGHNLLEPAALAKPCLTGPHTFNFVEVNAFMLEAEAAELVHNETELAHTVIKLMQDPILQKNMGQAGLAVVNHNKGALERMVETVKQYTP